MPRVWADTSVDMTMASGGGKDRQSLTTELTAAEARYTQMTLLRTIIGLDIAYAVHDSGEGSQGVSLGIGVVTQEAFAATVLPDPETSTDFPIRGWIWRYKTRIFGFAADQPAVYSRRVDLDLRSQRKLENGEVFINGHNGDFEGTASTVRVWGLVRQLWLVG